MTIRLLQLSDSHLHEQPGSCLIGVDTDDSLRKVVDLALQVDKPDLILATGDLSQDGSRKSYERFVQITQPLDAPVCWIPGNHDDPELFHHPSRGFPLMGRKTLDLGMWRVIMLDSVVPGRDYGRLADRELDYLQQQLNSSGGRYCIVVLHHQPVTTGTVWLDTMQVENHGAFFNILAQYDNVPAVVFGHIHQEFDRTVEGIRFLGSPSTCFQFKPKSEGFALDDTMPGYRLLILDDSGQLDTEVKRIAPMDMGANGDIMGY